MTREYEVGQFVIYPPHGLGQIAGYETQEVSGFKVELIAISFDKDKMLLRIPLPKAKASGLRPLSTPSDMEKALDLLKIKTRSRKAMWSRRAQEYETKINSGDPIAIAEVIRDLYRNESQADQSYSERQIYQAAVDRFARELAAIQSIDESKAIQKVEEFLKAA